MLNEAISVNNLSKAYKIVSPSNDNSSIQTKLSMGIKSILSRRNIFRPISTDDRSSADVSRSDIFWALKDVSFNVMRGEIVGVIGQNGAGKSTLLKILSRITNPTFGFAEINGRVGSLLEVGTGFHPELTGRENIYLNGTIMGMKRNEINRKFDEIVEFSEVEKFIDTPVKRYSSGMYVRLAFAVAAHLEPEILILDEVLAVGDADFQKKCLGQMDDVAKSGRTVVFVSHNMQAIGTLCSRAIWIDAGRIRNQGETTSVIKSYMTSALNSDPDSLERVWDNPDSAPGNDKIRLRKIKLVPATYETVPIIDISTPFMIEIEYWNLCPQNPLIVNLSFHNEQGIYVFRTLSTTDKEWYGRLVPPGLFRSVCYIPADLFNDGSYFMGLAFYSVAGVLFKEENAATFTLVDLKPRPSIFFHKLEGSVRPKLEWQTTRLLESQ